MRRLLPALALALAPQIAAAQCGGSFGGFVTGLADEAARRGYDAALVGSFFDGVPGAKAAPSSGARALASRKSTTTQVRPGTTSARRVARNNPGGSPFWSARRSPNQRFPSEPPNRPSNDAK